MITLDKLEKLRLNEVQIENFADEATILESLAGASEQGRQGWGVRREQAVMLGMAISMRVLAQIAGQSETAHNNLKGEQMAHGRTKKRLEAVERALNSAILASEGLVQKLDALEAAHVGG